MKKILCLFVLCCVAVGLVACFGGGETTTTTTEKKPDEVTVLTWSEFMQTEDDAPIVIEGYVQGKQSWWADKCSLYLQDENGGYFVYELTCSEEDYARLTVGTKIRVTGYKTSWADLHEVASGATFEIVDGSYVAEPVDLTDKLGTEELFNYQTTLVEFKGLTVVSIEYKNGAPGDDIYVTVSYNGAEYDFCVERYLTGPETEVYTTVGALVAGDVIDVVGFAYWYNGINTHITNVTVK